MTEYVSKHSDGPSLSHVGSPHQRQPEDIITPPPSSAVDNSGTPAVKKQAFYTNMADQAAYDRGIPREHIGIPSASTQANVHVPERSDSGGDSGEHNYPTSASSFRSSTNIDRTEPLTSPGHPAVSAEPILPALHSPSPAGSPLPPQPFKPRISWRLWIRYAWLSSKGMFMVMLAQFFGASMNVMTRILELDGPHGKGMHPFQVRSHCSLPLSYIHLYLY